MAYYLFLISINFLFLLLCSVNGAKTLYEGDQCVSHTGKNGICTAVISCPTAYEWTKNNTNNYFVVCGYRGIHQIVCCMDDLKSKTGEPDKNGGENRKATQVCKSYTEKFPVITSRRIIGGDESSPGEFPFMVALGFRSGRTTEFNCGGTLISKRYVLTAAHCIKTRNRPQIARMGTIDLSPSSRNFKDYKIEDYISHPNYRNSELYDDIGLLRLVNDVIFTTEILPACLYTELTDPAETLVAIGWGVTNYKKYIRSTILLKVGLEPLALDNCNNTYRQMKMESLQNGIIDTQLCTYDPEGKKDACQVDSGGPLILKKSTGGTYTVVGITSFARDCGAAPGVYTRVSSYLDWIELIVWPN